MKARQALKLGRISNGVAGPHGLRARSYALPTASRRYSVARQSGNRTGARLCRRPAAAGRDLDLAFLYFRRAAAGLLHSRAPVAEFASDLTYR